MVEALFVVPFLSGILSLYFNENHRKILLMVISIIHLFLSLMLWFTHPQPWFESYFKLSPEGLLVLLITSFLFLLITVYTVNYFKASDMQGKRLFICFMLLFLSTMSMAALADHLMVLWIAIEATTLASAPLIIVQRSKKSLEATLKYIMICSVGIALALLGSLFIIISMETGGVDVNISFSELTRLDAQLDPKWLKAGFIFILVGYGTKMGLAPMHTWLPDAHSESPSPVSALLSGVLLNCAYLGIFKTNRILYAAGLETFSSTILIVFGLISIIVASIFILRQSDYKRLLAYSSIENMGIIAFGTGIGGLAAFGAILHLIHHSLIKSALFLSSGNIFLAYHSKQIKQTGNMIQLLPKTFVSFFGGFAGISGFPPFGMFISEFCIIMGAFQKGYYISVGIFMVVLAILIVGLARHVIHIGFSPTNQDISFKERYALVIPQYIMLLISAILCFWIPDTLHRTILAAISTIGGGF
ncbi:MAG: hydrogenase [Candidatus Magnetomorum sp.]|nr:hydrogenase [Candidatus Magnetomorum sp.]